MSVRWWHHQPGSQAHELIRDHVAGGPTERRAGRGPGGYRPALRQRPAVRRALQRHLPRRLYPAGQQQGAARQCRALVDYAGSDVGSVANSGTPSRIAWRKPDFTMVRTSSFLPRPTPLRVQQSWETIGTEFFYGLGRAEVDFASVDAFAAYGQSLFRGSWLRTFGSALERPANSPPPASNIPATSQAKRRGGRPGRMATDRSTIRWPWWRPVTRNHRRRVRHGPPSPCRTTSTIRSSSMPRTARPSEARRRLPRHVLSFTLSESLSILDDRAQRLLGLRQQGIQNTNYAVTGARRAAIRRAPSRRRSACW